MKNTLRINGSVVASASPVANNAGEPLIHYKDAMQAILAYEEATSLPDIVREELPAIVSHWLQSPEDAPILLDESYSERWQDLLRSQLIPANTGARKGKKTRNPFHISFEGLPFLPVANPKFTFIDLFAGIGGFRIGLSRHGGKCVFSSEWDRHAKETYFQNYGEVPFGDITRLSGIEFIKSNVDVIAGGFPCQPFSRAGVSARNSLGQAHGFDCETQGQLFFDVIKIAKRLNPKVLFLENVGNLLKHDGGNTFRVIRETIENDLGYTFHSQTYNCNKLVPQNRVRCIIVALRDKKTFKNWLLPDLQGEPIPLKIILENMHWDTRYTLSKAMWDGHCRRSERNVARGTGFTAFPRDLEKPSSTLVARYYKDGKECLIPQPKHPEKRPRMLTERECARLQGFPEEFKPHPSKIAAYKQFGNAVPAPLIDVVARSIIKHL
jgi:DNA (cytosine-5)-methyltransferase 1